MSKKKTTPVELTAEDRHYIENHLTERTAQQMAAFLNKPEALVQALVDELAPPPPNSDITTEVNKSLMHEMMVPRKGMAIMTQSASEVGDDVAKKHKTHKAHSAIHRPLGNRK